MGWSGFHTDLEHSLQAVKGMTLYKTEKRAAQSEYADG